MPKKQTNTRLANPALDKTVLATVASAIEGREPRNGATGNRYVGANAALLGVAAASREFTSDIWFTRAQIKSLGSRIRKGERGTSVFAYDAVNVGGDTVHVPAPYKVYHLDQLEAPPTTLKL